MSTAPTAIAISTTRRASLTAKAINFIMDCFRPGRESDDNTAILVVKINPDETTDHQVMHRVQEAANAFASCATGDFRLVKTGPLGSKVILDGENDTVGDYLDYPDQQFLSVTMEPLPLTPA